MAQGVYIDANQFEARGVRQEKPGSHCRKTGPDSEAALLTISPRAVVTVRVLRIYILRPSPVPVING